MTYNFDPEWWYETEYSVLEALRKEGKPIEIEFKVACSDH